MSLQRQFRYSLLLMALATSGLTLIGTFFMVEIGLSALLHRLVMHGVSAHVVTMLGGAMAAAILLGSILAGAGAVALAWWLSRGLTLSLGARLAPYVALSRRVGQGDFDAVPAVRSEDELGELAYAFKQMAEGLREVERQRETLLASVAHDLRTPLTALQGNLEAMLNGLMEPDVRRLANLQEEVGRLIRLVEDLLALAQARAGALQIHCRDTDLAALTRSLIERFDPVAKTRQIAVESLVPRSARSYVDRDRVDEVLTNLVANALGHSPRGSSVRVSLRLHENGTAEWTVADNGPGIPQEILARVTEPFVRGDPARGPHAGSGLGLAIADAWVKAHGGSLKIRSGPEGTRVTVTIPGCQEAADQ